MGRIGFVGVAVAAGLLATGPAAATTVLTQALNLSLENNIYNGAFDLSGVLHDADGRTFAVTSARISTTGVSDPQFGPASLLTSIHPPLGIPSLEQIGGQDVLVFEDRTTNITTYHDTLADVAILSAYGGAVQGVALQNLLDSGERLISSVDGPVVTGPFGAQLTRTTVYEDYIREAVYGDIPLGMDVDGAALFAINGLRRFDFSLAVAGVAQFADATLSLELTQTGGPPAGPGPGVPEPATWALMLLGFGAAGAALRRRPLSPALSPARRRRHSSR
jgi:hypothetical protein